MATLSLRDGHRTRVWRVLRDRLLDDPAYKTAGVKVVAADDDDRDSTRGMETYGAPALRFTPALGTAGSWFHEGSLKAVLAVRVEACLQAPDLEDLMNLQEAIEDSLNPLDDDLVRALVAAGAALGQVAFGVCLKARNEAKARDDGLVFAEGQFTVEIERPLTRP